MDWTDMILCLFIFACITANNTVVQANKFLQLGHCNHTSGSFLNLKICTRR